MALTHYRDGMSQQKKYSFNSGTEKPQFTQQSETEDMKMSELTPDDTYSFYGRDTNPDPDRIALRLGLPIIPQNS